MFLLFHALSFPLISPPCFSSTRPHTQLSYAALQVNDFCLFGPPENDNEPIGNIEEKVVAYCSQPRNGARIIPDGALKSAHVSILSSAISRTSCCFFSFPDD
jgi:hypothetical protein